MDLVDWCSASILHVSLFAWPNHNTQKVRKSLQSVLADLFRFPVRFSQGNLEGKSEVKAGPFCWQAGTEVFLFLYFFPAADNAPQSRSWIQGTLWAVNCFRVVALELTMVVTSSDTGIMAIYWYSILMPQGSLCGRVSSISGGPERGAAMDVILKVPAWDLFPQPFWQHVMHLPSCLELLRASHL